MSKNLKQFTMETKEDYLFTLKGLYINVYRYLEQYKRYSEEIFKIHCDHVVVDEIKGIDIESIDMKNINIDSIGEENIKYHYEDVQRYIYEDINNKIHNVSNQLILFSADDSATSMSYRIFRRVFNKHNKLGLKLEEDKDLDDVLKELLNLRNWKFHNPQSLLVAHKEVFEREREHQEKEFLKRFPESIRPFLKPAINYALIDIPYYEKYDIEVLVSLRKHTEERIKIFEDILEKMKRDYSFILGAKVKVVEDYIDTPYKLANDKLAIANLSMAIQKGKYKGSDEEKYNEITMKDVRHKSEDK